MYDCAESDVLLAQPVLGIAAGQSVVAAEEHRDERRREFLELIHAGDGRASAEAARAGLEVHDIARGDTPERRASIPRETNLVGVLLRAAIKKPLTQYLSEKIWVPAGMEQQATWILSKSGNEISGCCIQAATRDFARFGQFVLGGAKVGGQSVVAPEWLAEATTKRTDIGKPGRGYGFQWWTYDDGSFAARGIFGQGIFIDPKRRLVVAINADWAAGARDPAASEAREAFYQAVRKAIDDEAASPSAAQ